MHETITVEPDPQWLRGEALRRAGVYGRAAAIFEQLWNRDRDPSAGWRWAYCLRRSGNTIDAARLIESVAADYPEHPQVTTERLWCLYETRFRSVAADGTPSEILEAATELVEAGAEGVVLRLAVFAAISAAKKQGQWERISGWCDLLRPDELEGRSRGKRSYSDRERWYYAKLKASLQLGEADVALRLGQDAVQQYPSNPDFRRWLAQAHAAGGQLEAAVELLEATRHNGQVKWYLLADLARFHLELGKLETAWRIAREAARLPGEDSAKVGLYETTARIALASGDPEAARDHLGLCLSLRARHDWRASQSLLELEHNVQHACDSAWQPADSAPVGEWKKRCKQARRRDIRDTDQRLRGTVDGLQEGRNFAFIRTAEGQESIFVASDDLPPTCQHNGATVDFVKVRSFDKRRQRDSWRATKVAPAPSPPRASQEGQP